MPTRSLYSRWVVTCLFCVTSLVDAAETPAPSSSANSSKAEARQEDTSAATATDPNYRLGAGDTVVLSIYGQDLSAQQTISRSGDVRLPLIKEVVPLAGKTVREAEAELEKLYREKELYNAPVVTLKVSSYFPRSVSVLGAVVKPGPFSFPPDTVSLDIVEVITQVGGFSPVAKADDVTVTRRSADGKETVSKLDLRDVMTGRRRAPRDRVEFLIYPGDRIWVPTTWY
jgi:polysaccharide biosynthesis/export protein